MREKAGERGTHTSSLTPSHPKGNWATRIRTWTNRTKICCATVTPSPSENQNGTCKTPAGGVDPSDGACREDLPSAVCQDQRTELAAKTPCVPRGALDARTRWVHQRTDHSRSRPWRHTRKVRRPRHRCSPCDPPETRSDQALRAGAGRSISRDGNARATPQPWQGPKAPLASVVDGSEGRKYRKSTRADSSCRSSPLTPHPPPPTPSRFLFQYVAESSTSSTSKSTRSLHAATH